MNCFKKMSKLCDSLENTHLNWSIDMKCLPSKLCTELAKEDAILLPNSLFTTVWTDFMVALPTLSMLLTCDDTVSFVELGLMIGNANTTRSWFFNGGEKLSISRNELCVYYVEMHGSWYRDCQRVSSTGRSTARKNSILAKIQIPSRLNQATRLDYTHDWIRSTSTVRRLLVAQNSNAALIFFRSHCLHHEFVRQEQC